MIDYNGLQCPICEKIFMDSDDVVVCPICGAPYHRHCYMEKGDCIFEELHEHGKSWEAPETPELKTAKEAEIKDQDCPACGVLNSHSSLFCSSCGSPLKIEPSNHANINKQNNQMPKFQSFGMGGIPIQFDPMGGVPLTDVIDENITYGEVSKVVQQNARYYMPVFKKIHDTKKSKFNLSAFLFSGPWLLYRKQYKQGIIATILLFFFYIGQTFATMFISLPIMENTLNQLGESIDWDTGITVDQLYLLADNLNSVQTFLMALPTILFLGMIVLMFVVGFNGNKMYMKHCIKTINKVRNTTVNTEDYNTRILESGGVNTSMVILVFVCYTLSTYLPLIFM